MNGSVTLAKSLVDMLNNATIPAGTGMSSFSLFKVLYDRLCNTRMLTQKPHAHTEVVISPPAIYIDRVRQSLKKEIGVAAQNSYVKASGAYTGEIRQVVEREGDGGKNSSYEISDGRNLSAWEMMLTLSLFHHTIALSNSRTWVLIGSSLVTLSVVNTLRNPTT